MHDLAKGNPEKLADMKKLFLAQAKENKVFPIGAGIWLRIHPEDRIKTPYTSWIFDDTTTRMPEFTAPSVGNTKQHDHYRPRVRRGCQRRALRSRWCGRRPHLLHG